jgi:hypothetical protein
MARTTTSSVEQRLIALEHEVERLKGRVNGGGQKRPWWEELFGKYANDPAFEEAMRLGREYRKSLDRKPKRKPTRKRSNARVGH